MTREHDLDRDLERWLEDGVRSAPSTTRVAVRSRVRTTRQRPWWLVRDRGDQFEARPGLQRRTREIAFGTVALIVAAGILSAVLRGPSAEVGQEPVGPTITTLPIPGLREPSGVGAGFGSLWVGTTEVATVRRVDPGSGSIVDVPAPNRNCGLITTFGGAVWVPPCSQGPLARIDPATNAATSLSYPDQRQIGLQIPFEGDRGWVTIDVDGGIFVEIDATGREVARGDLEALGSVGAAGFGSLWAARISAREVVRLDAETREVITSIGTELPPDLIVATEDAVWVSTGVEGTGRGDIVRIDPATNEIVARIPFRTWALPMATDGSSVWVLEGGPVGRLHRIDPTTNAVEQTVDLGSGIGYLALDGESIWVSKTGGLILVQNTR
jgi:streptogramin lyase